MAEIWIVPEWKTMTCLSNKILASSGHQQLWYWLSSPRILQFQHHKIRKWYSHACTVAIVKRKTTSALIIIQHWVIHPLPVIAIFYCMDKITYSSLITPRYLCANSSTNRWSAIDGRWYSYFVAYNQVCRGNGTRETHSNGFIVSWGVWGY